MTHPLAGQPAPESLRTNIPRLVSDYYTRQPDHQIAAQQVAFGTSGHRGSSSSNSFNEAHVLAIVQAICDYRKQQNIHGPLFLGMDTHALSEAAFATTLEVLAGNQVTVFYQEGRGVTPTPVISHAILTWNRQPAHPPADGIVITPSHNPPRDGGIKYNPPHGGPADTAVTRDLAHRANACLADSNQAVRRLTFEKALAASTTHPFDYIQPYVSDLNSILDLDSIRKAGLRLGVDPLGGSGLPFWEPIAHTYGLSIEVVNPVIDPAFQFMTVDKDGQIRMDCSSPHAMAGLIRLKDRYDLAFGNDPDTDRHGIVTPQGGLMNPNHYLAVAVWYLFRHRPQWPAQAAVGKTLVSSAMLDRVAAMLQRPLLEVPVGFKWFVPGLLDGSLAFGGEESAGAAFVRMDGSVWCTDKDGIIMNLLAAEITARTGEDPNQLYRHLVNIFGEPLYERLDAPASPEQKQLLAQLTPDLITAKTLAGDPITSCLTHAPGNQAPIGGLKVTTANGWFAARPSGTEDIYKIYAESFKDRAHLQQLQTEAREIVGRAFEGGIV